MSASIREKKEKQVAEIVQRFTDSKSTVITDYRGLTVAQVTELRKQLREAGIDYKVLKNTFVQRAVDEVELKGLEEYLFGPTAIAFSNNDLVAPAKIIADFAKKHKALEIKAGILEGKVLGVDQVKELAALPSRDGLLSMLLSVLQAPMRNVALAVKAVAEKEEASKA
jgi:large subunit ribosomal protein L10